MREERSLNAKTVHQRTQRRLNKQKNYGNYNGTIELINETLCKRNIQVIEFSQYKQEDNLKRKST